ncbi:MAG: arabinosyltransferase C-terminal domain-containing protein, partial [Pseudonocardiaceae bacterium]
YSDWGQPFGNHLLAGGTLFDVNRMAPHLGPVYLRNPLVWFVLAGALAGGITWWHRRGRQTTLTTDRGLLVGVSGLSVVLLLGTFVWAPVAQYPGWTPALSNLRALTGQGCGLATAVQVLAPAGPQPATTGGAAPTGGAALTGDFTLASAQDPVEPPSAAATVWHDAVPAQRAELRIERGSVVTPWFTLPPDTPATHLTVPVAAGALEGQQVSVQFGTGDPADPVPGRRKTLELDGGVDADTWQEVPVELSDRGATAVRIVARDRVTGAGSWLAVASPALGRWQPVDALTRGQPVFADQLSAILWPCVDQVAVRHGIAQLPSVRLLADDGIPEVILLNTFDPQWGGTHVQADRTATYVRAPSRIHPAGPPTRPWGNVQRVMYDHPVGLVDLRTERVVEPGWHREPPIIGMNYSGRPYLG